MELKLRIEADGTTNGTKVVNADTGEEVENVTEVYFNHQAGDEPMLSISLPNSVELILSAPLEENDNKKEE